MANLLAPGKILLDPSNESDDGLRKLNSLECRLEIPPERRGVVRCELP